MYPDTLDSKIYAKMISEIQEDPPVLASLVEQCRNLGNSKQIQQKWSNKIASEISSIAADNPYLPDLVEGDELLAIDAIAWVDGSRGFDTRPKFFDNVFCGTLGSKISGPSLNEGRRSMTQYKVNNL